MFLTRLPICDRKRGVYQGRYKRRFYEEAYSIGTYCRNGGCGHDAFRIRLCHDRAGAAQKESGGTGSEKQCDGIDADGSGCRPSDWDGFVDCHEGILKRQRRSDDFVYSGSFPDEDGRECEGNRTGEYCRRKAVRVFCNG